MLYDFKAIFTEIAEQHIEEACQYYNSLPYRNVADNFLNDLDHIITLIEGNPFVQLWDNNYRAIPLLKFPYLVFFEIIELEIIIKIVAIFHTAQNPDKYPL